MPETEFKIECEKTRAKVFSLVPLVSDLPNHAPILDADLRNPWGVQIVRNVLWVAINGSGLLKNYQLNGQPGPIRAKVLSPTGDFGTPTGLAFNCSPNFGGATFLMSTEDG